jgi:signal peptidase I
MPGLGHLYAGDLRAALTVFVAAPIVGAITLILAMLPLQPFNIFAPALLIISFYFGAAYHASRTAGRHSTPSRLRPFQRWYVYGAVVLLSVFFLQPLLKNLLNRFGVESLMATSFSMEPAVLHGDYFFTSPVVNPIRRGNVVVFQWPEESGSRFIMRVVGVALDTLEMRDGRLLINGRAESLPVRRQSSPDTFHESMDWQLGYLVSSSDRYHPTRDRWGPIALPRGTIFVLGDNREDSFDSRFRGLVPEDLIISRARTVYFSRDSAGAIRWRRIGHAIR